MICFDGAGNVLLTNKISAEEHERIWRSGDVALRAALSGWAAFTRRRSRCGDRRKERRCWRFRIRVETVIFWFNKSDRSDVGSKSNAFGRRLADTVITMLERIHRDWREVLRAKYRIDPIRRAYGGQVRNAYDGMMYEERACLGSKGRCRE